MHNSASVMLFKEEPKAFFVLQACGRNALCQQQPTDKFNVCSSASCSVDSRKDFYVIRKTYCGIME